MATQEQQPLVQPVKMPKMKMPGNRAATLNAFALSFAAFFGFMTIMAAIAGFTDGEWLFNIPLIGTVLANVSIVSTVLTTALMAVLFAVVGMLTVSKITNIEDVKKAWCGVARVFLVLALIYAATMVSIMIYSLLAIGSKSGVSQSNLWLVNFIPNLITMAAAGGMWLIARQIANGKTAMLKILSILGVVIAGVGLILVIVQTLVGFYSGPSVPSLPGGLDNLLDLWF
jgi:hypothetical protein